MVVVSIIHNEALLVETDFRPPAIEFRGGQMAIRNGSGQSPHNKKKWGNHKPKDLIIKDPLHINVSTAAAEKVYLLLLQCIVLNTRICSNC